MTWARQRIGIFEFSRGPSGPSRYVHAILRTIDPAEFDVVLFGHAGGPYQGSARQLVAVSGDEPLSAAPAGPPESAGPPPASSVVRRAWKRLAPPGLKLWGGVGKRCCSLVRDFQRCRVDLLHTNDTGCEESALAARLAGISRILGTFHVDSTYDLQQTRAGFGHRLLECVSNRCLDQAIAVSDATRRDWVRRTHIAAERVRTIANGVDPERFRRQRPAVEARRRLGVPEDGLVIGAVGRLEPVKGFDYLLKAVALLSPEHPKLCVVLAGTGPERTTLVRQAERLGLGARAHFLGFCPDVQMVYDALDVFVLPSLAEAMPYALLEAMSTGLPAVGAHVGGVGEVISPGQTGFTVPPRNAIALASALQPLLASAEVRDRLGRQGRERVTREFTEEASARRTIDVYRAMLRGRRE